MFNTLRSAKARKLTGWILVLAVVLPFIFYYGWSPGRRPVSRTAPIAAEVNGVPIYTVDLPRIRLDVALQAARGNVQVLRLPAEDLKNYFPDDMVLDEAIRGELLTQLALKDGLVLSPRERQDALSAFVLLHIGQPDARLSPAQYEQAFRAIARDMYGYTPAQMEQYVLRQALRNRAMRALLYPQARASILELWQAYEEKHTRYRLDCAVFRVSEHLASEEISDADIEEFYNTHREDFTVEPQVVYKYIAVHRDELESTVTVSSAEVSAEYRNNLRAYSTPAAYELSQIVMDAEAGGDEVPAAVQQVERRLSGGEDFAAVAREVSVDQLTRDNGGRLGSTNLEYLDPRAAAAIEPLAAGQITPALHIGNAWIIYRVDSVTPAVTRSFSEVEDQIRETLKQRRVDAIYQEKESDFQEVNGSHSDLQEMAAALNLEIQTSDPVAPDANSVPGLGAIDQVRPDLMRLEVGQILPDVMVTPNTLAIIQLAERRDRTVKPLDDDLRRFIRMRLAQIRAEETAEDDAYALRSAALSAPRDVSGEFFAGAVEASPELRSKIEFEEIQTEPFAPAADDIEQVGQVPDLSRKLYYSPALSLSGVEEIRQRGGTRAAGYVLWLVRERVAPSQADFYADLETLRAQVLLENQDRVVAEWYADAQQPGANKIVRYDLTND
jgi:peptidyl-prolyl cis-trans isomerase D